MQTRFVFNGHVSLTKGLAGYDVYFGFGRPCNGHENFVANFW
jgi:hypothetical protein